MEHATRPQPTPPRDPRAGTDTPREAARRVGHALRTPLTAILGFSDMLADGANLTPQQKQAVEMIRQGGQQLLAAVEHLQLHARIDWEPPAPVPASAPVPLAASPAAAPATALIPPPDDLRERFDQVARAGNMRQVLQLADELAQRGSDHAPLAHELRRLAGRYESRALAALADRLREEASA